MKLKLNYIFDTTLPSYEYCIDQPIAVQQDALLALIAQLQYALSDSGNDKRVPFGSQPVASD